MIKPGCVQHDCDECQSREQERNDLIEALRGLMDWQVRNVDKWHNRAYDHAAHVLEKLGAGDTPKTHKEMGACGVGISN